MSKMCKQKMFSHFVQPLWVAVYSLHFQTEFLLNVHFKVVQFGLGHEFSCATCILRSAESARAFLKFALDRALLILNI